MIKITNLSAFDAEVTRWFRAVEEAAGEAARGLAQSAFDQILENSPQFSGDFVANWRVGTSVTSEFTPNAVGGGSLKGAFQKGDGLAIAYAKSNAKWPTPRLGTPIYLFNSASHDEPYAVKIEAGEIAFRPVNKGADHPVRKAALNVGFTYENVNQAMLEKLRNYGK